MRARETAVGEVLGVFLEGNQEEIMRHEFEGGGGGASESRGED